MLYLKGNFDRRLISMAAPVEPAAADLEALANPTPPAAPVPAVVDPVLPAPPAPPAQPTGPLDNTTVSKI